MSDNVDNDFPIFSVYGEQYFEEEANNLVELNNSIVQLSDVLDTITSDLANAGNRLNLYINNVIELEEKFDYDEHIIVFDKEENLCIYPGKIVDDFIEENKDEDDDIVLSQTELDDLLDSLPLTENKFKLKKKQQNHVIELMEEFNSIFAQYEYYVYEFNEFTNEYNEIIRNVKNELLGPTFIDITKVINKNYKIEKFDENKHELLVTRDAETLKWKFVYVRKSDRKKFEKIIKKDR